MQYRQGDVLLESIESIPRGLGLVPKPRENGAVILAEGEVTGHFHGIVAEAATLFSGPGPDAYLLLAAEAELTHQEHSPIRLPAGSYIVRRQREYAPIESPLSREMSGTGRARRQRRGRNEAGSEVAAGPGAAAPRRRARRSNTRYVSD